MLIQRKSLNGGRVFARKGTEHAQGFAAPERDKTPTSFSVRLYRGAVHSRKGRC